MTKYIIRDVTSMLRYLPYGLLAGMIVVIVLSVINNRRMKKNKEPLSVMAITGFMMYLVVLLFITFLSREGGSNKGIDMKLFSTWGINTRNNAYVIENILLFIPYGFFCAWIIKEINNIFICTLLGAATSLIIEWLQLLTGRGFFQIDDVVTNTIGAMMGYLIFRIFRKPPRRK